MALEGWHYGFLTGRGLASFTWHPARCLRLRRRFPVEAVWIMDRISTEVEADPDYRDAIGAVQDEGLAGPSDIIAGTTNPLRIECLTTS